MLAGAIGLSLATWHAWGGLWMPALWMLVAVGAAAAPRVAPWVLLASVPWIGLAPWTGAVVLEEVDLAVLAVVAGAGARWAWSGWMRPPRSEWRMGTGVQLTLALMLGLGALSMVRLLLTPNLAWPTDGWSALASGFMTPFNALRLCKPVIALLLLWPLWRRSVQSDPRALWQWMPRAMAAGLLGTLWPAVLERWSFTGLLNFNTDYRSTGPFWEMQVGGATLDGALVLGLPFVLAAALQVPRRWALALYAGVLAMGGYVALTMFSRGVYLALPLSLGLTFALVLWQARTPAVASAPALDDGLGPRQLGWGLVLAAVAAVAFGFPDGGWRMLAVVAVAAVFRGVLPQRPRRRWRSAAGAVGVAALLCAGAWAGGGKAVYLAWALLVLGLWMARRAGRAHLAWGAWGGLWLGVVAIAWVWHEGMPSAGLMLSVLVGGLWAWGRADRAVVEGRASGPGAWPRWVAAQMALLMTMAVMGGVMGGSYMSARSSTAGRDLDGRMHHWAQALSLWHTSNDVLFGVGPGQFPRRYQDIAPVQDQVGRIEWKPAQGEGLRLMLQAGQHAMSSGEMLRLSQRVRRPEGVVLVQMRVHVTTPTPVHVELCDLQLLYPGLCLREQIMVPPPARPGDGVDVAFTLGLAERMGGTWWAPRPVHAALALPQPSAQAWVQSFQLLDGRGALLENSDFSEGLNHWIVTSENHHMPWHAKSLPVHVAVELGLPMAVLLGGLWLVAVVRCSVGAACQHPLAPGLAGALLGFAIVGLFDSLIDAPRLQLMAGAVLLCALALRDAPARPKAVGSHGHAAPA